MDIKIVITAAAAILLCYILWHHRRHIRLPFLLALAMALAWTSYYRYEYVGENIFLFDQVNVYPLTLWTLGLTTLYLATTIFRKHRFGFFTLLTIYVACLAAIEIVGYYLLNIRLTSDYTSLLGLGIIHAPLLMKVFYVIAGPLYLSLVRIAK